MKKIILTIMVMAWFVTGCAQVPTKDINIAAEADPKANFSGYKTYAWLGSAEILHDEFGQWEPTPFDADAEIKYLLDRELRGRGMMENSSDPDLFVAFIAGVDMDALDLKTNPDTKIETLENVPQGGMAVILIDADSGFVIWVGVATGDVQQNANADTAKARLDYIVKHMIKKLPK